MAAAPSLVPSRLFPRPSSRFAVLAGHHYSKVKHGAACGRARESDGVRLVALRLVLSRKTRSKGFRDSLAQAQALSRERRVRLIGPACRRTRVAYSLPQSTQERLSQLSASEHHTVPTHLAHSKALTLAARPHPLHQVIPKKSERVKSAQALSTRRRRGPCHRCRPPLGRRVRSPPGWGAGYTNA